MRTFVALLPLSAKQSGGRAKPARLLCGVASAALMFGIAGASQAGGGPTLSLSASTLRVLYTNPVTLTGRLSSHQAGRTVTILGRAYGKSSPQKMATVKTRAGGYWSRRLEPSIATSYQARSGSALSRSLTVGVQPALTVVEAGDGRIWALARSDRHFTGRMIQLQQRTAGGAWQTTAKQPLSRFSTAIFPPRSTAATIRVAFSVNEAGAGYLGSTSHPLIYKAYAVTLLPSTFRVLHGNTVTLNGSLRNALPGQRITIQAWPYGRSAPIHLATVTTGITGTWSFQAKPGIGTSYQALWAGTETSARLHVGVMPAITVRQLGSGHIWTHVDAGRSFAGRKVQLQTRMGANHWKTLMQMHLDAHSSVVFSAQIPTSTVRIALSVNQAGPGFLGSASPTLSYHAT
jgi:hypothetical protein